MLSNVAWSVHACEKRIKRVSAAVALALALGVTMGVPARAAGQIPHENEATDAAHADTADTHGNAAQGADDHGAGDHGADAHHEESFWATVGRITNFALLAGGLFYFLRKPVADHLAARGTQIRGDLALAAQVKADAAERLREIEARLKNLPAELEQVRQRGAEELAAEEARILQQAEVERARLVAQTQRDIEQQVRTARHALTSHAAALAVGVAEDRLRATLTADDQRRLAEGFTREIGGAQ